MSQNQDQTWFADGLAEEILNALARAPDLLVSSRTSSFAYKGSDKDLPTIAREIGVAHILEGSVRRAGNRLRVTAQLIRASDGFHLWSQNYDRDEEDVIDIQEDLAIKIATALETTMDPQALANMLKVGTRSVEAYQEYIHGVALKAESWATGDNDQILEALTHHERARTIDPDFSSAHLEVARFWRTQISPTDTTSEITPHSNQERLENFRTAIDLAINTAPNPIDRDIRTAIKAAVELRLRDAFRFLERYLSERPNDYAARYDYFYFSNILAEREISLRELEYWRARADTDVDAATTYLNTAYRLIDASVAADYGLAALERWPDHHDLLYQTHRTLLWARRFDEARDVAQRFEQFYAPYSAGDSLVAARQACVDGRRDEVLKILAGVDPAANRLSLRWLMQLMLGEPEKAIEEIRYYETDGILYQFISYLQYHKFDPTPFPELMVLLEREKINRPPPVEMAFSCPAE